MFYSMSGCWVAFLCLLSFPHCVHFFLSSFTWLPLFLQIVVLSCLRPRFYFAPFFFLFYTRGCLLPCSLPFLHSFICYSLFSFYFTLFSPLSYFLPFLSSFILAFPHSFFPFAFLSFILHYYQSVFSLFLLPSFPLFIDIYSLFSLPFPAFLSFIFSYC